MKHSTIRQLNEINTRFYQLTAAEFSKTRGFYWQGWRDLLPQLEDLKKGRPNIKVLDLGCGNGRFGEFLEKHFGKKGFEYHGGDKSQELLAFAKKRLEAKNIHHQIFEMDLIEELLHDKLGESFPQKKYHLITLFGVLHHIPSKTLRKQLFKKLQNHLTQDGLFVFTAWRFLNEERFTKKQIHPDIVGVPAGELEENDFILDWQRGITAYRYCHFTTDEEMKELVAETGLEVVQEYTADGKSGNLNAYTVAKKT